MSSSTALLKRDEKGESWTLAPYRRRVLEMALRRHASGELVYRLVVLSEPKKSGKTFMAACLALWWAVTNPHTELIITANDLEQSVSGVFKMAVALIEHNEAIAGSRCALKLHPDAQRNGDFADRQRYKGAARSRNSLVVYDEMWDFESEKARRCTKHRRQLSPAHGF